MPKKLTLPAPPVVPTQPTTGNLQDWAQKLVNWALDTRGKIESWSVNSGYLGIVTAEDTYAALAGNSSQTFSVADASTSHEAVSYEQVLNTTPLANVNGIPSAGTSVTSTTSTLTAPSKGIAIAMGQNSNTTGNGANCTLSSSLAGFVSLQASAYGYGGFGIGYLPMTAGQTSTFTCTATQTTSGDIAAFVEVFFLPLG